MYCVLYFCNYLRRKRTTSLAARCVGASLLNPTLYLLDDDPNNIRVLRG